MLCEDRISALPDDLLVTILISLPIKDAVTTMILSKRWRYMWSMLPILDYREVSLDSEESKKSIWWFIDKSLQHHNAPVIGILRVKLGPHCPSDVDVRKLVAKAIDRRVVVLTLDLLWSVDPTSLPKTLYSCKTLKTLSLSDKILVDVPSHVCLPSLTMLRLNRVVYKNDDSLIRFLSSCPILKSLMITRTKSDNMKKFIVKVPYLLELVYTNWSCDNDAEDTGRCLVIDTPALKEFNIADCSGDPWSIASTPCIKKLFIDVDWNFPNIDKFLRSFSGVSFLELDLTEEMMKCCSTIKFSRVENCKILLRNSDLMDSLVPFLHNTPKLKFLVVDNNVCPSEPPIASSVGSESSCYDPKCLYSSLEKFELVDYGGRGEEQQLVEYILTKSRCLKTATIFFLSSDLNLEQDKDTMVEKLKAIPRVSRTSQLLFKS